MVTRDHTLLPFQYLWPCRVLFGVSYFMGRHDPQTLLKVHHPRSSYTVPLQFSTLINPFQSRVNRMSNEKGTVGCLRPKLGVRWDRGSWPNLRTEGLEVEVTEVPPVFWVMVVSEWDLRDTPGHWYNPKHRFLIILTSTLIQTSRQLEFYPL